MLGTRSIKITEETFSNGTENPATEIKKLLLSTKEDTCGECSAPKTLRLYIHGDHNFWMNPRNIAKLRNFLNELNLGD